MSTKKKPRSAAGTAAKRPSPQRNRMLVAILAMEGPHDFRVPLQTNDPLSPDKEIAVLSNWVR